MTSADTAAPRVPYTGRPKFSLPAGTCDTRCHIFGPAARFRYAPSRTYTPADAPKEALAELHQRLGVARAVTPALQSKLLVDNPARLYGFPSA